MSDTDQTMDELMGGPGSPRPDVSSRRDPEKLKEPQNEDAPPFASIPPFDPGQSK
ncbi:hypothetical protein [Cohnella kolymensis]|uniref:hypothetical protein n=1 Tax=Cohnella kolymensis TaxID=1590652 RepID=UPI000ACD16A1|nr:hypothetical protein [Cohnella kolymensis]